VNPTRPAPVDDARLRWAAESLTGKVKTDVNSSSGDGCYNDTFPTLSTICDNEKIVIRHESWGCFHHYEDVFEIAGNAPLDVDVYRRHPQGDTTKLEIVEAKGTVALTETDIDEANRFIAHYLACGLQEASPIPSVSSTTEDTLRLIWYRDGEILETIRIRDYQRPFPFLSGILSRAR